jgi:cell wall-associated NlpC family hydrolase
LELLSTEADFYKVRFPDGRQAFVPKEEAQEYSTWISNLSGEAEALVEISKTLMGVPYLWGGTSTKGVDCSGFTKTIYFLNGMVIPRDASQQVHTGKQIDSTANFDALEKGDLLFFGRKATAESPEKVVHVGMWIGDNQFIHSSEMVRISSVDKNDENYDAYNVGRYLRSKRILKEEDVNIIDLKKVFNVKG